MYTNKKIHRKSHSCIPGKCRIWEWGFSLFLEFSLDKGSIDEWCEAYHPADQGGAAEAAYGRAAVDVRLCPPVLVINWCLYTPGGFRLGTVSGDLCGEQRPGRRYYRGKFHGDCPGGVYLCRCRRGPDFY